MESISKINKTTRKAKKSASQLVVPELGDTNKLSFVVYCDASFGTQDNGGSQEGHIIYLVGGNGKYVPISWQSRRIKRVVKSTHAAETLAMVNTMEACVYFRKLLLETLLLEDVPTALPITCKTDNTAVRDAAYSSTQILDKRLRIETAIIREMLEHNVVRDLQWIPTACQVADGLTKRGVPSNKILDHISVPRVPLP